MNALLVRDRKSEKARARGCSLALLFRLFVLPSFSSSSSIFSSCFGKSAPLNFDHKEIDSVFETCSDASSVERFERERFRFSTLHREASCITSEV